ncbi:GNAT family N-acetyltransferase [Neobacillus sp. D3-1R]|uniref:GNAT family N-acetyltransferase n=1 Tax=Neobacillus sp. D3-1R TaxID=3445778 RepID=UPI003F9ED277
MNLSTSSPHQLVQFNEYDIPGLIELSASVGWDYDRYEIQTVMSCGKIFGHKNEKGKVISSAAIMEYGKSFASIGMVIVHDLYRGLGLGRMATQKCLDSVSSQTITMLIATEAGKPMYEKMGFQTTDSIHKFLCDHYIPNHTNNEVQHIHPMTVEDYSKVFELDQKAFGENRQQFLVNRMAQAQEALILKNEDNQIIGYGLSIKGPVHLVLGPIVAPNPHMAFSLIDCLAKNHLGPLRIDIPSGNESLIEIIERSGFIKASNPPIMIINGKELPPRNKTLFAIAAQIFG